MKSERLKTELLFTETYKRHRNDHPAIREAMCLKVQYPAFFTQIQEGDLFAGRIKNTLVGITPDEWGTAAFGYYCVKDKILKEFEDKAIDEETRKKVLEMVEFWSKESTSAKIRAAYTDEMKKYLPSDDWMHQCGIAFPLYRLTGGNVNWEVLLKKGIPGLIKEAEEARQNAISENKEPEFYEGIKIALEVLVNVCHWYAKQAIDLKSQTKDEKRREELQQIADTLEIITVSAPKTMREAIQLFWLYSYVGDIRNYGRMDVWLGDFLASDLASGILNEEEALTLLQSLWRLIGARNTIVHSRIIIGGRGRRNEQNADKFALLAMEASRTVNVIEPQLSLRFYNGMNPV
jgi:pyruvate-formate lyase